MSAKPPQTPTNGLSLQLNAHSEAETLRFARSLARLLQPGDVVALDGELGAGKTCFVRGMADGLGIDPAQVSSPTFVIAHEYAGPTGATLAHVDAYRLNGVEDLESIGWNEMLAADDVIVAVEWPSRISAAMPSKRIDVQLQAVGETERLIRVAAPPELAARLAPLGAAPPAAPKARTVACRMCGRTVDPSARSFPFCSDRCRMADLGAWFKGGYMTSRPATGDEELSD